MMSRASAQPQTELNLKALRQASYLNNYSYAEKFAKVDFKQLKEDLRVCLTTSQDWWPADYGHYGPLMCRLAWHLSGTYRIFDGRGGSNSGNIRMAPHGGWPDNGNLDKARRLLWPVKQKYGQSVSWGDLMILAGNVGMEDMGFKTFGFGAGRIDCWQTEDDAWWGEAGNYGGKLDADPEALEKPLGAPNMELIYVNPEGPSGKPELEGAIKHIRSSFARMAMNDEETVALIGGGHAFGKAHGAAPGGGNVGPDPRGASVEEQGFGWANKHGTGKGADTITSGLEGAWTTNPIKWDNEYFQNMLKYEWELYKGPGGANQWRPKNHAETKTPVAHGEGHTHIMMFTTDLALVTDPEYKRISKNFAEDLDALTASFGRAWYKLCHKDMGPPARLLGPEVAPPQLWQDPVTAPAADKVITADQVTALKASISASGVRIRNLVRTAWASAATYRKTDHRGGANGARIRLAPQKDWAVNDPPALAPVLTAYEKIQAEFNGANSQQVSMADLIVLGGCVGVEIAAKNAGFTISVPFTPGRGDATEEQTNPSSFAVLEPESDAFRNYKANPWQMVDRAHMLGLTAPEMTVLVGGLRVLNVNSTNDLLGVLTERVDTLSNDFFVFLTDMQHEWVKTDDPMVFQSRDRASGKEEMGATRSQVAPLKASLADLTFGSNFELRAIVEHYGCDDAKEEFVNDFAKAFSKVMHNDMF